jgi:hypothetical protein
LDSNAAFEVTGFNGRGLADDVMDVMLALVTKTALGDGAAPDQRRIRPEFPDFGEPYANAQPIVAPGPGSEKEVGSDPVYNSIHWSSTEGAC